MSEEDARDLESIDTGSGILFFPFSCAPSAPGTLRDEALSLSMLRITHDKLTQTATNVPLTDDFTTCPDP